MRLATLAAAAVLAACAEPRTALAHGGEGTARSGPYSVEILDESGWALPTYFHSGRVYVMGTHGRRYLVRVRNGSPRRAEVVVSVDGRDVIDGKPASFGKPGYVVNAWSEVVIDGYRLSEVSVAAFRFGTVSRSYASRMGDARDVGVIGVAVFPEREPRPRPPPHVPYGTRRDRAEAESGAGAPAQEARPSDAAPSARAPEAARKSAERPGLGTEFGEERESHVVEVAFERARSRPDAVLAVRYDDRAGLVAIGIDVDHRGHDGREAWLRESATPFRGSGYAEPPPGWGR
jgi:hypothetical protein